MEDGRLEEKDVKRLTNAVITVFIVVLALVGVGAAALPAVLAYLFGWYWLIAYPVLLFLLFLCIYRKKEGVKHGRT